MRRGRCAGRTNRWNSRCSLSHAYLHLEFQTHPSRSQVNSINTCENDAAYWQTGYCRCRRKEQLVRDGDRPQTKRTTTMTSNSIRTNGANSNAVLDALPLFGRILLAAIFLLSGCSKIANPTGMANYIASAGLPYPMVGLVGAYSGRILGWYRPSSGIQGALCRGDTRIILHSHRHLFSANLADKNQFLHFFKNVAITGGLRFSCCLRDRPAMPGQPLEADR